MCYGTLWGVKPVVTHQRLGRTGECHMQQNQAGNNSAESAAFAGWNAVASGGSYLTVLGAICFFYVDYKTQSLVSSC